MSEGLVFTIWSVGIILGLIPGLIHYYFYNKLLTSLKSKSYEIEGKYENFGLNPISKIKHIEKKFIETLSEEERLYINKSKKYHYIQCSYFALFIGTFFLVVIPLLYG